MQDYTRRRFWKDAFAIRGSATPKVLPDVATFGVISAAICFLAWQAEQSFAIRIGLEVAPHEIIGAALGLLLILRTNAGYDRWWEARKLWGGIVNQSRNLAISALAYGPDQPLWRSQFIRWAAVFPHAARASLRQQPVPAEITALLGREAEVHLANANHMPNVVAYVLARQLHIACVNHNLDRFAFLQIDKERALLIDHIGACERILKTPLPLVYSIKIRRFITLFLATLPFVLLHRLSSDWLVPSITMLVAYPLLALDRIGSELQNPFSEKNLSHLPLTEISANIERNLFALLLDCELNAELAALADQPAIQTLTPAARRA